MKFKITIMILSALFLVAVCTCDHIYIDRTFTEFDNKITEIASEETYDLQKILDTEKWWEQRKKILELSVSVTLLHDLSYTYGELIGAVRTEDFQSAAGYLERLHNYCICLKDTYKISPNNIF